MPAPFGLLQVQGPDASKFLQGQVTCDVTHTTLTQGVYGAHCNPKGRVLFSFYLLRRAEDCFWLQISHSMIEQALKDLGKYSVFSKVKLSRVESPMRLVKTSIQLEQSIMQDKQGVIRKRSNGYTEIIGQPLAFAQFTDSSEETNDWNLLDIQEGIAQIYPETRELFTPEEINFTLIDAVSFRKGCYTGQEIVARMHYKGKHKRHAHRFLTESVDTPIPGTAILSSENGQKIGELISAASVGDRQEFECLASVQDDARNTALLSTNREKMRVVSLPYAIPVSDIE